MKLFPKNGFLALLCLCRSHPQYRKKYPNAALDMRDLLVLARFGARHPRTLLALRWLSGWLTCIPGLPVPQTAGSQPDLISAGEWISSGPAPAKRVEGFEILDFFVTFLVKQKSKAKKKHGCNDPGKTVPLQINKGRSAITSTSPRLAFLHNRSRLSWLAPIFLCLLFLNGKVAEAQSPAAVAGEPSPLSVGDTFQDMLLENVLFHVEPSLDTKTLVGKAIILDFWATWCGACVSAFPKNEAIAERHKDRLAIVPVTYEPAAKVGKFISGLREKRGWPLAMPFVTGNTGLGKLFPHQSLPHYVWISADRKVAAITSSQQINEENVGRLLAGAPLNLEVKKDSYIRYDKTGLLIAGNPQYGPKPILFQSVLTGHIENLSSEHILEQPPIEGIHRFVFLNWTLGNLAVSAFGEGDNRKYFGDNRLFLEVADPERLVPSAKNRGDAIKNWMLGNTYCYELLLPDTLAGLQYRYLQEDLRRYFPQYAFVVETRELEVLRIVRTDSLERYRGDPRGELGFGFSVTGGSIRNIMLNGLVGYLNIYLMQDSPYPVVDCTGIDVPVSMNLDADMTDPASIAAALRPYGLDMVRGRMPLEVLVIRDSGYKNNKP